MPAYNFPLLLKHILNYGVAWAPAQEIVYRDLVRHTYTTMYNRVLRLAGALQALGVKPGTRVGVIEWDSHRSQELENLLSLHEGVLEAAVIGIPDEKWGERPLAIVVPREEYKGKLTGDMLRAHLNRYVEEGLITNWSVPENYSFVDELPKTSVGKIDKKVLRSRYGAA